MAAKKKELAEATAKMERVLWTNRHVTGKAAAAFGNKGVASSAVAAKFKKRSLADGTRRYWSLLPHFTLRHFVVDDRLIFGACADIKARQAGLHVRDDESAQANPAAAPETLSEEEEDDEDEERPADAKKRWRQAAAWQKRVAVLAAGHPPQKEDRLMAMLQQASGSRSSSKPAVTFSAAKANELRIPSRSASAVPSRTPDGAVPPLLPRPPAASAQSSRAEVGLSPARRSLVDPADGADKLAEEARLRANIARVRKKLAAKKLQQQRRQSEV